MLAHIVDDGSYGSADLLNERRESGDSHTGIRRDVPCRCFIVS